MSELLEVVHRIGVVLDAIEFYMSITRSSVATNRFDEADLKNVDKAIRAAEELLGHLKELRKLIEENVEDGEEE